MRPRDRRHIRETRRSPIDTVLGGGAGVGGGAGTSPVDEVLGGGGNGGGETTGEENPWVNPFMEVYETTKTGAMKNLEEMQKGMAERFAHRGGYFGGQHAIGQGKMAAETGTALDQLLAQTSLGASEREYQDWQRARQEEFMPMQLISMLLGQDTFENIVQQPGQSSGGILGSLLGMLGGSVLGPMGAAVGGGAGDQLCKLLGLC